MFHNSNDDNNDNKEDNWMTVVASTVISGANL